MRARLASPAVVREWGRAHGWKLGDRGRVPQELWDEYADAVESRMSAAQEAARPVTEALSQHAPMTLDEAAQAVARAAGARLQPDGSTFAWERSAYVVRDADGVELMRSTLGGDCARWATERGVLLGARESSYGGSSITPDEESAHDAA